MHFICLLLFVFRNISRAETEMMTETKMITAFSFNVSASASHLVCIYYLTMVGYSSSLPVTSFELKTLFFAYAYIRTCEYVMLEYQLARDNAS